MQNIQCKVQNAAKIRAMTGFHFSFCICHFALNILFLRTRRRLT
jgi:hypothetical protein